MKRDPGFEIQTNVALGIEPIIFLGIIIMIVAVVDGIGRVVM